MNEITGWWVCVDVAKSKLDVALLDERGKVKAHVFNNDAKGFAQGETARNKTDQSNAALLARFAQAMRPEAWMSPSQEIRALRALVDRL
jgi:transposase